MGRIDTPAWIERKQPVGNAGPVCNLGDVDLETGDLSQFDAVLDPGSHLTNTAASAMGGTSRGMNVEAHPTDIAIADIALAPPASGQIRMRFYIDPNGMTVGGNFDTFICATISLSASPFWLVQIDLRIVGAQYSLRTRFFDDGGNSLTDVDITDAPHYVEVHVVQDAALGSAELFIDGVSEASFANLDNFDTFALLNTADFGLVQNMDATIAGDFFIDEICINDDGSEIGA